jgi:hypothetical protein
MAQRTNIIASAVPTIEIGIASSVLALVRNISGAFGKSVFATILNNATETNLIKILRYCIVNTTDPLLRAEAATLMTLKAKIDGFRAVFLIAGFIMFAAAFIAMLTLNIKELN